MKTKQIPALIMLFAGFVTCIIGIFEGVDSLRFTKILLAVLIGFYLFGCVVKVIIDKNFADVKEKTENEESPNSEESEAASDNQTDKEQTEDIKSEGDNEK